MFAKSETDTLHSLEQQARELELAHHRTWLKLLHMPAHGGHSEIQSNSFFLSPRGQSDPEAELSATLRAYFAPLVEGDSEQHARCKFPARYYWLSQYLQLPGYTLDGFGCERFDRWSLHKHVKSVSIYLVSGYFGNPASTFGHALLRLNTHSKNDRKGFFDLAIGYGALVPENENPIRYIIRGLSGGYEAGFSDKYFYTQDLVYTHTEFRDIWDYELLLTEKERTLLILHLWEILGKKFRYYFLDKNCGYRLAELLDLVIEEGTLQKARHWYIPVELFHRLQTIDVQRKAAGRAPLIKSIRGIPSARRSLYHHFAQLKSSEINAANKIIRAGANTELQELAAFSTERQMVILNALIAYQKYRHIRTNPDPEDLAAQHKILHERLKYPPQQSPLPEAPMPPSPAAGSRPMAWGTGIGMEQDGDAFFSLRWTGFSQEAIGNNSLEGGEFVIGDVTLGTDPSGNIFLDRLDILKISNLKTMPVAIHGEAHRSWQGQLSVNRFSHGHDDDYDAVAAAGIGRAWRLNDHLLGSAMLQARVHSHAPHLRIRPRLELTASLHSSRVNAWLAIENNAAHNQAIKDVWALRWQSNLTQNHALQFAFSNEWASRYSLSFLYFW